MPVHSLLDACDKVQASYAGNFPGAKLRFIGADIIAVLDRDDTLYIPGTDSGADWWIFNLPTARIEGSFWPIFAQGPAAGMGFYKGFLRHAAWLAGALQTRGVRPSYIVGHSLGGASAQILALHFGVPALTFAAPKVTPDAARAGGEAGILNLVHPGDTVAKFPFAREARHLGDVFRMSAGGAQGLVHRLPLYKRYVRPDIAAAKLGSTWPTGARSVRQNI